MDIDYLQLRHAVSEWRDRQLFAVAALLNEAALAARRDLDALLDDDAAPLRAVWNPAGFVDHHVDTFMRERLGGGIDDLLRTGAQALRGLDGRYAELADALGSSAPALELPAAAKPPAAPPPAPEIEAASPSPAEPAAPARLEGLFARVGQLRDTFGDSPAAATAREWSVWAWDGITDTAETVRRTVQDRAGFNDRLRRAAGQRIAVAWMHDAAPSHAVRTQLVGLIDGVTTEARSMSL